MNHYSVGDHTVERLLRPLLIASMLVCLAAPAITILEGIVAGWDGTYFMVFAFVAALEGVFSERLLQRRRLTGGVYLASRGAELFLWLLVLKLANYLPLGLDQLRADASTWTIYLEGFITPVDLATGLLFVPLWLGGLFVARQASELDVLPHKATPPADRTSAEYYRWLTQPPLVRDREQALARLRNAFLQGGIAMLVVSALLHFLLPASAAPALPLLLYFALGLALLSQAHFSVTHTGWQVQGLSIQPGIARRWLSWAIVFLVVVALVALLLPTAYSMGPVLALYLLLAFVAQVFATLLALAAYLLALLLSWLLPSAVMPPSPPRELIPAQAVDTLSHAAPPPWLEVVASALFWAIIGIIAFYAMARVVRDRTGALDVEDTAFEGLWGRFLRWLRRLWLRCLNWGQDVQGRLVPGPRAGAHTSPLGARLGHFFSLRRLSPRELIRYFYLSTAARAARAGHPRQPSQTPDEYRADLVERYPDLRLDLGSLTEAFQQARYSRRALDSQAAAEVKPAWRRIRAALRRLRAPQRE